LEIEYKFTKCFKNKYYNSLEIHTYHIYWEY